MKRWGLVLRSVLVAACALAPSLLTPAQTAAEYDNQPPGNGCARSKLCLDVGEQYGSYVGHDEPSLVFYSDAPGAGNNNVWRIQLPKDPPLRPRDDGSGGTWNFQLHPAFWFGMAMCDTTSAPEFTNQCTPDSDSNIFDDGDPASPHYIGRHPGTAFMELQFYPPSWVEWPGAEANAGGSSCDAVRWCVALNVDSLLENMNVAGPNGAPLLNNAACRAKVGDETINFAFLTKDGHSIAPADPLVSFGVPLSKSVTPDPQKVAFFNSGDTLEVSLRDTPDGLLTVIHDLDSGETGSMTASPANGFAHLLFQPTATTCTSVPYAFHPMYSTASEHTRVPWAAHSYNIAYSDEIGHFEFCPNVQNASIANGTGVCASASASDPAGPDADDTEPSGFCFTKDMSSLVRINGCTNSDDDFDGPEYQNTWPGTNPIPFVDRLLHSTPIRFTSPLIGGETNFERLADETDLPRIEGTQGCSRLTGAGCTDPPQGASFYPFFTTGFGNLGGGDDDERSRLRDSCVWREGGRFLPNTRPGNFTTSADEYGALLQLTYPSVGFQPIQRINDYRRVVPLNPCAASEGRESDD